tara:strand:+ start:1147 stop:2673 length:1527 start_codon:yes stop_codon:yes gene_type:complete
MNRIDRSRTGIATLGRDEDQFMAHVALGERIVPPVITPETQARIDAEMQAAGLNPYEYKVGEGMSINPITGLPEFGFLKKTWKSVKKVVKKVAPIAAVIPGPWQPYAAVYMKGSSALKIAKGEGGIGDVLALASGGNQKLFGDTGAFAKIGGTAVGTAGGSSLGFFDSIKKIGQVDGAFNPLQYGINVAKSKASDLNQGLGGLFGGGGGSFNVNTGMMEYGPTGMSASAYKIKPGDSLSKIAAENNTTVEALQKANGLGSSTTIFAGKDLAIPKSGGLFGGILGGGGMGSSSGSRFSGLFGKDSVADKIFNVDPNKGTGPLSFLGGGSGGSGGLFGGGGGLGSLAKIGGAGLLAKVVYDDFKRREGGIANTPLVSMDQLGRYQLASDLGTGGTRGEFGLAPKPTVLNVANGGPIDNRMYYAEGGLAAIKELDMRDGGESAGPGTGTSDDIPAMLSDGEFVMTAAATKGAGSYKLNKSKSGIELVSGGKPSRDKGVENMRELMNIFEAV